MFQENLKRILIDMCLAAAFILNIYYLSTTHCEFIISLFHYRMFNISALSYTVMRFIYILLPLFLLAPVGRTNKLKRIKWSFYLIGILYILGSTWIFYFLAENPLSMLSNTEATKEYLQLHALNSDYLIWDSYDLFGILFSFIEGTLYIALGYYIDKHRKRSTKIYWATIILSIALPFIYVYLISSVGEFSSLWLRKNTVLFASGVFTGVGLTIASTSRGMWNELLWT